MPKKWAEHDAYCQLIPDFEDENQVYEMMPRLGTFEVTYKGIIVFSKLLTNIWPSLHNVSKKVVQLFENEENLDPYQLRDRYQIRPESAQKRVRCSSSGRPQSASSSSPQRIFCGQQPQVLENPADMFLVRPQSKRNQRNSIEVIKELPPRRTKDSVPSVENQP